MLLHTKYKPILNEFHNKESPPYSTPTFPPKISFPSAVLPPVSPPPSVSLSIEIVFGTGTLPVLATTGTPTDCGIGTCSTGYSKGDGGGGILTGCCCGIGMST